MEPLTLYLGNKNYSSWSLRPWLAMKLAGLSFHEEIITLDAPGTRREILRHSPAGRVPILKHGTLTVWDSMAICEYIAELAPEARLWPEDPSSRATARSMSMEMHAGFAAMRNELSMNITGHFPGKKRSADAEADVARVLSMWRECRTRLPAGGPFLFGHFTIADAMYAPVVSRFRSFDVALDDVLAAYSDAVWNLGPMQEWIAAAREEPKLPLHEAASSGGDS